MTGPPRRNRILYVQYGNPAAYPPLEHSARQLADAGYDVFFLGAHTAGVEALSLAPHERIRVTLRPASRGGWRLKFHYLRFCLWVAWQAALYRPRWVYASDVLSTPIAFFLKTVFRRRVIYHEHDAHDPERATAFMRLCMAARGRLVGISDLNVLPSDGRIDHFCRHNAVLRDRCVRVWNCPDLAEVRPPRSATTREALGLLFQGSIVPARLPIAVLQAMAQLPETVTLRVIGYETIDNLGYVDRLKAEATRLQLGARVEFLGAIPNRKRMLELSDTCAVGLAFMPMKTQDVNMRSMAGASNKAFEYLACGLSLLVSDRAEWRAMFAEPGYARVCDPDDAGSIAAAIRWYLEDPDRARAMGERGRQRVLSEWNYERQFAPVLRTITERA